MKGLNNKLEYETFDDATTPRDGEVLTNRWWVVHPEYGVAFYRMYPRDPYRAPQCNHDERIARDICDRLYPGHEVRLIPAVFVGHRPQGDC
jgi:hypothetical protein